MSIKTPVSITQVSFGNGPPVNYSISDATGRDLPWEEICAALNERAWLREACEAARDTRFPGGIYCEEWCDYWRAGNDQYKGDEMTFNDLRNELAFVADVLAKITAALSKGAGDE